MLLKIMKLFESLESSKKSCGLASVRSKKILKSFKVPFLKFLKKYATN